MYDFVNEDSDYFVIFFESWMDSRNKVKVKINNDNVVIEGGNLRIFNTIFLRDDVLDSIDYTEFAVFCYMGKHPLRFELEIDSQHNGFFYLKFRNQMVE